MKVDQHCLFYNTSLCSDYNRKLFANGCKKAEVSSEEGSSVAVTYLMFCVGNGNYNNMINTVEFAVSWCCLC